MIKNIIYKIQSTIFTFIGDIRWTGITHPFWFIINDCLYKLRGEHYRMIEHIIKPGDILIRKFDTYVDKFLLPGDWSHGGIYIGENKVVHSMSQGIIIEDILDFMRTDHMLILRHPNTSLSQRSIEIAKTIVGMPYDFGFDFNDCNRFSCTELVNYCYGNILTPKARVLSLGKPVIIADDFVNCSHFEKIWDSTDENITSFVAMSYKNRIKKTEKVRKKA